MAAGNLREMPKVDLLHDNADPNVAKLGSWKTAELTWEVMPCTVLSRFDSCRLLPISCLEPSPGNTANSRNKFKCFFGFQPVQFWSNRVGKLPGH